MCNIKKKQAQTFYHLCYESIKVHTYIQDHGIVFFLSGESARERREAGVGFALRKELAATFKEDTEAVNDMIMTMRLPSSEETMRYLHKCICPHFHQRRGGKGIVLL